MTNDNDLENRYADVLAYSAGKENDPDLELLLADLEHIYTSETVPPELEERIAAALLQRGKSSMSPAAAARSHAARITTTTTNGLEYPQQRPNDRGIGMKLPGRISVTAASVAACLVVVLISLLLYGAHTGANVPSFQQRFAQLGGIQVVLAEPAGTSASASIAADINTIQQRLVTAAGINSSNLLIYVDSANHLVVDIAGVQVADQTITSLLTTTGLLDFIDIGTSGNPVWLGTDVSGLTCTTSCKPDQYKIVFTGSQLDPNSIQASIDQASNQPVVVFEFRPAFQRAFATYTQNNVGNYLTITLDNKVIESAVINSEITGLAEISGGNMTLAQAVSLAAELKYGALRVPLKIIHQTTFQPGTPVPAATSTLTASTPTEVATATATVRGPSTP